MTEVSRFYVREFLNLPGHHAGAYVLAEVIEEIDRDGHRYTSTTLDIADCSRKVSLDLSTHPAERENTFRKLDLLIDTLQGVRRVLVEVLAEEEWHREHPA
ncbi:MAG TPA: hypothetical protein VGA70_03775 [Longimicrobiales bacterium]|jgi:hypothetical protein